MSNQKAIKRAILLLRAALLCRGYSSYQAVAKDLGISREAVRRAVANLAAGRSPRGPAAAGIKKILSRPSMKVEPIPGSPDPDNELTHKNSGESMPNFGEVPPVEAGVAGV